MKNIIDVLNESIFSKKGVRVLSEDYDNLRGWVALASKYGVGNIKNDIEKYKACPKVVEFYKHIQTNQVESLTNLIFRLNKAISDNEKYIELDKNLQYIVILLCRFVFDNAYTYTKDVDQLHKLQLKLAAQ